MAGTQTKKENPLPIGLSLKLIDTNDHKTITRD